MIISCNILLPNDRVHGIPPETSKLITPTPKFHKLIEVDVAPITTIVITASNFVFRVFL